MSAIIEAKNNKLMLLLNNLKIQFQLLSLTTVA